MNRAYTIKKLKSTDHTFIQEIAQWYYMEWGSPINKTAHRFSTLPNEDIYFQLVACNHDTLLATGGLSNTPSLIKTHPRFSIYSPWVFGVYTGQAFRKNGLGGTMLCEIEAEAKALQMFKIYLYTYSAENLYKRFGWDTIDSLIYRGHHTVVMEKHL